MWWIRAPWRIRCIPSALQSKVTPRRVGAAECDLMPPAGGRAVLCGRNFHDPEDLTVCTDCQVFAIMEAGCRRGTGSTPGCGMTGGQTTQMGARLSVARDTPRTRVILECSPRAPDPPPSPDPPRKSRPGRRERAAGGAAGTTAASGTPGNVTAGLTTTAVSSSAATTARPRHLIPASLYRALLPAGSRYWSVRRTCR